MRIFGGIASGTRYRPLPPKIKYSQMFASPRGVSKVGMAQSPPATHFR